MFHKQKIFWFIVIFQIKTFLIKTASCPYLHSISSLFYSYSSFFTAIRPENPHLVLRAEYFENTRIIFESEEQNNFISLFEPEIFCLKWSLTYWKKILFIRCRNFQYWTASISCATDLLQFVTSKVA